jgi:hypothetical protein
MSTNKNLQEKNKIIPSKMKEIAELREITELRIPSDEETLPRKCLETFEKATKW